MLATSPHERLRDLCLLQRSSEAHSNTSTILVHSRTRGTPRHPPARGAAHRYADEPRRTSHRQAESDPRSVPRKADGLARHYRERATGELPTARFERRLSDRHPQAAGQRWAASLPPIPKGVVADAISSSTTGHHAASMWCSYSSTAVSREACARDRPRWRTRVRCTSGGAPPARAEARGDDQHRTEPA